MFNRSIVIIDLEQPNIEWLNEEPECIQSWRGISLFRIAEEDQGVDFASTEWFCDACGARIEDEFEGCPVCS